MAPSPAAWRLPLAFSDPIPSSLLPTSVDRTRRADRRESCECPDAWGSRGNCSPRARSPKAPRVRLCGHGAATSSLSACLPDPAARSAIQSVAVGSAESRATPGSRPGSRRIRCASRLRRRARRSRWQPAPATPTRRRPRPLARSSHRRRGAGTLSAERHMRMTRLDDAMGDWQPASRTRRARCAAAASPPGRGRGRSSAWRAASDHQVQLANA